MGRLTNGQEYGESSLRAHGRRDWGDPRAGANPYDLAAHGGSSRAGGGAQRTLIVLSGRPQRALSGRLWSWHIVVWWAVRIVQTRRVAVWERTKGTTHMDTKLARMLGAGAFVAAGALGLAHQAPAPAAHAAAALQAEQVSMVVVSGVHLGTDKKLHDAFTPTDIVARVSQKVVVTVYNYDQGSHSFTAPALHLNIVFAAATRAGVPTVKTFSFTVGKAGSYHWQCLMPCDDTAKGWAMAHAGYMAGTVTIIGR